LEAEIVRQKGNKVLFEFDTAYPAVYLFILQLAGSEAGPTR
jgi:hypothetical protein